jgi:predicted DNA binding CopG/RHH family protein
MTLKKIHSIDEIPKHMSEDEAAEFWGSHAMSEELLEASILDDQDDLPRRGGAKSISIRLDQDLLSRLQKMAKRKHMGYQTLMKQFLIERAYEEEKKEEHEKVNS